MENLLTWLRANKMRRYQLAEKVGISATQLSAYIKGRNNPKLEVAYRIERITDGAVPATSWIERDDLAPESEE